MKDKTKLKQINEIVQEFEDSTEAAVHLAFKGFTVSLAEGRRLHRMLKEVPDEQTDTDQ